MQIPMEDPKVREAYSLPSMHFSIVVENEMYRIRCSKVKALEAFYRLNDAVVRGRYG